MKIRIKLDLYFLKENFIATLCGKKNVCQGLSKSSEMVVKCRKGRSPKSQINIGYDHLQHEGLPGIDRINVLISAFGM